ncbi:DsrE family protein [Roseiconus lacunae]|uniref:DsrE family protein n=1 Tax=Roseiconus lacunae TaxID=2605694 RepID=A0ABT7PEI8_9BACT|nr:DsrE family protein [Roseiconus lacunae]MDM4014704.1 DsrE family protein [Roseiconus lacunae]WRQ50294.1 DsrE family protein [Stieleria sp. HD01]
MAESKSRNVVVTLKVGKSDNGKNAALAFSCGLSALAMGHRSVVFLTGDGAVWGYKGSADGIAVQGFPPLADMIEDYIASEGRVILCSVCHRTCSTGGPGQRSATEKLESAEIAGFATILELAADGITMSF